MTSLLSARTTTGAPRPPAAPRTVTVAPGVDLAVYDTCPAAQTACATVVLLHGLASTHHWWDLVAEHLGGLRLIRLDHRGHGRSSSPPSGYSITGLAADTAAVLDLL